MPVSPPPSRSGSTSTQVVRKRALVGWTSRGGETDAGEPPLRRARRDVLSTEVETLKAELEHERSLRALDAKRHQQTQKRLERQVEFAVAEAQEAKTIMEELREESENHMEQLRDARAQAQMELRDVQCQLEDAEQRLAQRACDDDDDDSEDDDDNDDDEFGEDDSNQENMASNSRLKKRRLQAKLLEATKAERDGLLVKVGELRDEIRQMAESRKAEREQQKTQKDDPMVREGALSAAPSEVLQELNKVRIQLAESQRQNRQLKRTTEDLKKKAKQLIHERESTKSARTRVQQLETQLQEEVHQREAAQAELDSWKDFGTRITGFLASSSKKTTRGGHNPNLPPELSVVQRYLSEATKQGEDSRTELQAVKNELSQAQEMIQTLEAAARESDRKQDSWKKEREDLEKQVAMLDNMKELQQGQEKIWKREVESLRSIIKTFDELPLQQGGTFGSSSSSSSGLPTKASMDVLQARLDATEKKLEIVTAELESCQNQLKTSIQEKATLQQTHNTVLEKFGKLRDAVHAERAKSEQAEARAVRAEQLAGKGAYDPDTTRVLHLHHNPLHDALKQEIDVLRRQVKAFQQQQQQQQSEDGKEKSTTSAAVVVGVDVDPNKLHQRLKESFKEQIGRFREGVYMLTGYKIDMIPGSERPMFKVRSVFAEQEQDHLMFQWPQKEHEANGMDLLDTDMAKQLSLSDSFQYIKRFHSMPAFLASVQLSLFEKQTIMT